MRKDEKGNDIPSTLGEYRDLCALLAGERCKAVQLLDIKIASVKSGRDAEVLVPDEDMRALLIPRMFDDGNDIPDSKDSEEAHDAYDARLKTALRMLGKKE